MDFSPSHTPLLRISILGAGNMGTALAQALALQGRCVTIWDHFPEVVREIRERRTNERFLPSVALNPNIHATSSASECVSGAGIVVICVPSQFTESVLTPIVPYLHSRAVLVNVAKGFAPEGNDILPSWLEKIAPGHSCAQLAGPALANEIANGYPTFLVVAAADHTVGNRVADVLAGDILIPSVSTDLWGATVCGILKNSYAIFLGLLDGIGPGGRNLEASALVLCGLEMSAIISAEGGRPETIHGLAGMGDLLATGLAGNSHNRKLGGMLAQGQSLGQIEEQTGWLPEGCKATASLLRMVNRRGQKAPLLKCVGQVLDGAKPEMVMLLAALRLSRA